MSIIKDKITKGLKKGFDLNLPWYLYIIVIELKEHLSTPPPPKPMIWSINFTNGWWPILFCNKQKRCRYRNPSHQSKSKGGHLQQTLGAHRRTDGHNRQSQLPLVPALPSSNSLLVPFVVSRSTTLEFFIPHCCLPLVKVMRSSWAQYGRGWTIMAKTGATYTRYVFFFFFYSSSIYHFLTWVCFLTTHHTTASRCCYWITCWRMDPHRL